MTGIEARKPSERVHCHWPGGDRRTFTREDVIAFGKQRQYGSFLTRYVVRLAGDVTVFVKATEQSAEDARWLRSLGRALRTTGYATRDNPEVIDWMTVEKGNDQVKTKDDISDRILRIVKHHKSLTKRLILGYFDDANDPENEAAEILDGMITAGDLVMSPQGVFVQLPKGGRGIK